MQHFAPIALFVYNRPEHTRRTIKFLQQNLLAEESRLFIFSDGSKNAAQQDKVSKVREIIHEVEGFKNVEVIERATNFGLAASIIDGVSKLVNEYGKVIVFEDDLITSPYTLQYFNNALAKFEHEDKVMHIGAYMYPLNNDSLPETFFYRIATSWGWATWKRAWRQFEPDVQVLMRQFDQKLISEFSIDRTMDFWRQLRQFRSGKNNSWAIRWYASIFLKQGLSLNPSQSLVNNIGHDGTGIHSGINDIYNVAINPKPVTQFPDEIKEHAGAHEAIKSFLKKRKGSFMQRLMRYINQQFNINKPSI